MTDFKVGDTVRVKSGTGRDYYKDLDGVEFVVTFVNSGYVANDKYVGGFWFKDVELVKPTDPWRYNDHLVVYPGTENQGAHLGRGVTVLNEKPLPRVYTRWEDQDYPADDEITEAARAYFDAHPAPKPAWHDPKPGEVWELTFNANTALDRAAYVAGDWSFIGPDHGVPQDDPRIVSARRIYPESE